ncbi:MAG: DUF3795 domain-containing protein [Candidatus Thermoplasmatota archaeon]|nr:DUF3795 domain-containing protein [Candidatus Thermoplasmatota archaeon]
MTRSRRASGSRPKGKSAAFENVKNQLAYCGLWCGSCSVGNGTVNELSRRCAQTITDYGVNEWGPKEVDYKAMLKALAIVSTMGPCLGCLKGGGRTGCEIRACAIKKGITECVDCADQDSCPNGKILHHMRSGALRVGMKVKDKAGDSSKILADWIAEVDSV